MLEFAIVIAMAVAVAGIGLIVAAFIGKAILDDIDDVCKENEHEEDSRTAGKDWHQDNDPFLN